MLDGSLLGSNRMGVGEVVSSAIDEFGRKERRKKRRRKTRLTVQQNRLNVESLIPDLQV